MYDTEIAIVGAGASGLSLAHRLCTGGLPRTASRVTLVGAPPGPARQPPRTWCFWEGSGGDFDAAVTAAWDTLRVHAPDGTALTGRPSPLRYKMLSSGDFEALVGGRLARTPGLRRVEAVVHDVADLGEGAEVRGLTADGRQLTLRARWVFDSRPPRVLPPCRTALLQHFRGWFLRADRPVFDMHAADLMDFRTPQPAHGLSFGYVLPTTPYEALVEYTEFSAAVLELEEYERALRRYVAEGLGLERYEVTRTEQGVIPMTDARFPRRAARSVFRIGTAGGATRPSTGYTFAGVQRQVRAVAAALRQGRTPVPPPVHSARSLAMDAVLLRALDTGRVDGAEFFTGLFRRVPMERLLRFLDGGTRWHEDIAIGLRTPVRPMLRTAAELPLLRRRSAGRALPAAG